MTIIPSALPTTCCSRGTRACEPPRCGRVNVLPCALYHCVQQQHGQERAERRRVPVAPLGCSLRAAGGRLHLSQPLPEADVAPAAPCAGPSTCCPTPSPRRLCRPRRRTRRFVYAGRLSREKGLPRCCMRRDWRACRCWSPATARCASALAAGADRSGVPRPAGRRRSGRLLSRLPGRSRAFGVGRERAHGRARAHGARPARHRQPDGRNPGAGPRRHGGSPRPRRRRTGARRGAAHSRDDASRSPTALGRGARARQRRSSARRRISTACCESTTTFCARPRRTPTDMRVAVIGSRGMPGVPGGIERHVEELYPRLAALGVDVTVYARREYVPEDCVVEGSTSSRCRPIGGRYGEALSHTAQSIAHASRRGFDLLHMHAIGPGVLLPEARLLGLSPPCSPSTRSTTDARSGVRGARASCAPARW